MVDSATAGMPASPIAVETTPSCMTPPRWGWCAPAGRERSWSSSWRASWPPARCWYWSARRLTQLGHLRQLLAVHPAGDRGQEPDRNRRLLGRALAQRQDVPRRVDGRSGVGHGQDPAVAARSRGASAGLEVLLVLVAGGPKVDVGIEEGREDRLSLGVDGFAV